MSDAAMSVTIEWFGCATFRVRAGELTLFFDTYLDKAPGVPPAGLRAAEVERADFLFISHAHFDHLYGADIIAKATGATLVGNYESVRLMRANGVPGAQIVVTAGGDTVDCGHGVTVRALPSQHSSGPTSASPPPHWQLGSSPSGSVQAGQMSLIGSPRAQPLADACRWPL